MRDRQWPDKPWCRPSGPWLRVPQERRKACLAAGALAGAFTGTGPRFLRLIPLRHLVDHRPHQIVAAAVASASASSHRAPPSVHAACEQSRDDWPCLLACLSACESSDWPCDPCTSRLTHHHAHVLLCAPAPPASGHSTIPLRILLPLKPARAQLARHRLAATP